MERTCGTWLKPKGNEDIITPLEPRLFERVCGTWLKPKGNEDLDGVIWLGFGAKSAERG